MPKKPKALPPPSLPPAPYPRQTTSINAALGVSSLEEESFLALCMQNQMEFRVSNCLREGHLELDLSQLELSELPGPSLSALPWLQVIDLNRNDLQVHSLSSGLLSHATLPELRSLSLNHNAFVGPLPGTLGDLAPCLEELSLEGNLITQVPATLGALSRLEWVSLANNRLAEFPGAVLSGWGGSLRHLDLRCNQLVSLPSELGECKALEELYVSDCLLASLPDTIGGCTNLVVLAAARNALVALPPSLALCQSLQCLDLTNNQLGALPGELVEGWPELRELLLSNNALPALPEQMGTLSQLEVLAASNNLLTSLPQSLGECRALKELYLQANKALSTLPESVEGWKSLNTIILKMCKFKTLPP